MATNYFIGRGISKYLSGIEQAQLRRLQLFKQHQQSAKMLFLASNQNLHDQIQQYHITEADFISLFEFFQNTRHMPQVKYGLAEFLQDYPSKIRDLGQEIGLHGYDLYVQNQLTWQVRVTEDTGQVFSAYKVKNNRIEYINLYDGRGFLSSRLVANTSGIIIRQDYLTPDGKVAMVFSYKDYQHNSITGVELPLVKQQFKAMAELYGYFFDQINEDSNSIFYYDRDLPLASLFKMQTKHQTVMVVHNNHEQPIIPNEEKTKYATFYEQLFDEYAKYPFDQIVVATKQQRADILAKYDLPAGVVVTIPVSWVNKTKMVPASERTKHSLIMVNRIAPEKRVMDVIKAFEIVVQSVPDATLKIYGNAVGEQNEQLVEEANRYILAHQLFGKAQFAGFTTLLDSRYDQATVGVMTSTVEGFNIAMLEELNHGIPVVAYDIKYGPRDMIDDGRNGYLVANGDIEALAAQIIKIMTNPLLENQLSQGAYQKATEFSEAEIWQKWQVMLTQLKTSEPKG